MDEIFREYMNINFIKTIFENAANNLLEKQNVKISSFLIILSQTFHIMKNDKEYFRTVDFWYNKLDNLISQEL